MAVKEIAVKKCVVKLSMEEREQLDTLIRSSKHPARKLTRARILLKADAGEAGEGWSDSQIAAALDIDLATVARVGQRRIRGRHGRRAGGLSQTARSRSSGGLCGRDLKAIDPRDAGADPGECPDSLRHMTMSNERNSPRRCGDRSP